MSALSVRLAKLEERIAQLEGCVAELEVAPRPAAAKRRLSMATVLQSVSAVFDVPVEHIRAPFRHARLMPARQAAVTLARRHTDLPLTVIGQAMARDHSTVIHHLACAERRLIEDPDFAARVSAASQQLQRSLSDA